MEDGPDLPMWNSNQERDHQGGLITAVHRLHLDEHQLLAHVLGGAVAICMMLALLALVRH